MNTRHHPIPKGTLGEREWAAQEWAVQERAMQDEAAGAPDAHDPLVARYRVVSRALREAMPPALPANFAEMLAARVGRAPLDTRVEGTLANLLTGLLVLSGLVVAALYGAEWLRASLALVPAMSTEAVQWILVGGAGVALSWTLSALARSGLRPGHAA